MAKNINFLLGYGERLTSDIVPISGGGPKNDPYIFEESVARLSSSAATVTENIAHLPRKACPHDEAVAIMTLHPAYLAKSYFPANLLASTGLRSVGSRPSHVKPQKTTRKTGPEQTPTVEIFVAGKRDKFKLFAENLMSQRFDIISQDIIKIEDFRAFNSGERVRGMSHERSEFLPLEVAIHAGNSKEFDYVLKGFQDYLADLDVSLDYERRIQTNGLCFFPVYTEYNNIEKIERFSYLRVIREMPKLRIFTPTFRRAAEYDPIPCQLPNVPPIDKNLRVAIFDGGIKAGLPDLEKWVKRKKGQGVGDAIEAGTNHGLGVTSAFLFGPISHGMALSAPYAAVDHYRVIDEHTDGGSDLFDVLPRVLNVLERGDHQFFNLSIGPDIPVEDDEVEVWTSSLDEVLSDGTMLATIAVGNSGELDYDSGLSRIQVPSDCVNGMAVGSCDSLGSRFWRRANYSCLGPGRSPGLVKPDVMAFGGSFDDPFFVLNPENTNEAIPVCGTSFAAPSVLRLAAGVRAHFGGQLSPLAIKALLINKSDMQGHDRIEVGWGKVPEDIDTIVKCSDGVVTVVYQGKLEPSKYIRAQIPTPSDPINGMVRLTATLCFASETDPQDASNYTRSGIEVFFRPNEQSTSGSSEQAKTGPFFGQKNYKTESELRNDAHKWETVLHASHNKRGSSLCNPTFDIHYNARACGGRPDGAKRIPYALVITLEAKNDIDLYNKVVTRFRTQLEPLLPVIEIPLKATI